MTSSPERPALWLGPDLEGRSTITIDRPDPPAAREVASWLPELSPANGHGEDATERAYARGVQEGLARGRAEAESQLRPALAALAGVGAQLRAQEREFMRGRERSLEALALAVARKLIEREVTVDATLLRGLITKALDLLPPEERLEVRLHPEDLAVMHEAVEADVIAGRLPASQWIADPSIGRGGFLVESPHRIIDGRLDVALRNLFERLDHE